MTYDIPIALIRQYQIGEQDVEDPEDSLFAGSVRKWSDDHDTLPLITGRYDESVFDRLEQIATVLVREGCTNVKVLKLSNQYLKKRVRYRALIAAGDKVTLNTLNKIPTAVEGFCQQLPNQRFFEYDDDRLVAWRLLSCKYNNSSRDNPAYVMFTFGAIRENNEVSKKFSVYSRNIGKSKTLADLIDLFRLMPETEELNQEWLVLQEVMATMIADKGNVYQAEGLAQRSQSNRWSSYGGQSFQFRSGQPNEVVMDNFGYIEESENNKSSGKQVFAMHSALTGQSENVPIHPFVGVFYLEEHVWLTCHVDSLTMYEFQGEQLLSKLVLPDSHKELISILLEMSKMSIEDIIKGKKGGSFIMSTGNPGTGKTLTAEVFAEVIKRPLYKVQCSQLGLNVEEVEKNLKLVLMRASRWSAILLIDEADVYVRSRGNDIQQNAIVGVFLRTLEYYSGILFMTSNLETEIDDAIMSRATAHLVYEIPSDNDRLEIWSILNEQFDVGLSTVDILSMNNTFQGIVGRDVKAILKLGLMVAKSKGRRCTVDDLIKVSKFVPNVKVI